jgi:hypothetical protein
MVAEFFYLSDWGYVILVEACFKQLHIKSAVFKKSMLFLKNRDSISTTRFSNSWFCFWEFVNSELSRWTAYLVSPDRISSTSLSVILSPDAFHHFLFCSVSSFTDVNQLAFPENIRSVAAKLIGYNWNSSMYDQLAYKPRAWRKASHQTKRHWKIAEEPEKETPIKRRTWRKHKGRNRGG